MTTPPPPAPAPPRYENESLLQGGARVTLTTQNVEHFATIGCLFTDGHKIYALTSRHVAGDAGELVKTAGGLPVGRTSHYQLGRLPFETVYPSWPGKNMFVNLDVALVEIDDVRAWSSGIRDIGPIGALAELSTFNLSLNLIGCPVRAFGAGSGLLEGRIAALFYRYKSVGGFDYVADFLIGSRSNVPLATVPGDSGAVWVVDDYAKPGQAAPFAVQWGGAAFGQRRTTFALASNLSSIARELNLDVYRGPDAAAFEYWGAVGHGTIGERACALVQKKRLGQLLAANLTQMAWLANAPDQKWKGGVRPSETPTHYSDMDFRSPKTHNKSLDDLTSTAAKLDVGVWRKYYDDLAWFGSKRGLLPFRVWQVYQELVGYIRRKDLDHIVAAAGVLAHYVGDSCQPLHSSVFTNGDVFRDGDGNDLDEPRGPFDDIYGSGVHSAYETKMLSQFKGTSTKPNTLTYLLDHAMPEKHGMPLVSAGRAAAWASIQLMRRARGRLKPMDVVETFAGASGDPIRALWNAYKDETVETIIDGCRTLAMLWDSAWEEGAGDDIAEDDLGASENSDLLDIVLHDPRFLPSIDLDHIAAKL